MRSLVAISTLIQFFVATALGTCVISWRQMNCDLPLPQECSRSETARAMSCCSAQPECPVEIPPPCQDRTRVVWLIVLSLDPAIVPCCAHITLTPELTDFYDGHRAFDHSPEMALAAMVPSHITLPQSDVSPYQSRPPGVHSIISTTVLRC